MNIATISNKGLTQKGEIRNLAQIGENTSQKKTGAICATKAARMATENLTERGTHNMKITRGLLAILSLLMYGCGTMSYEQGAAIAEAGRQFSEDSQHIAERQEDYSQAIMQNCINNLNNNPALQYNPYPAPYNQFYTP